MSAIRGVRPLLFALALLPGLSVLAPIEAGAASGLTEYTDTYVVQHPYNLPQSATFSVTSYPIYNTWVHNNDAAHAPGNHTGPRTEMRWGDWSGNEHLWGAYVWIDSGTVNTTFMQVKGAAGGEAMYMNVKANGSIYQGFGGAPIGTNMEGHWFYMDVDFDPVTKLGHAWINGQLVYTHSYGTSLTTVWYFKNGVYDGFGGASYLTSTHFADVQFWSGSASPSTPPPAPSQLPPTPPPPGQGGGPTPPPTATPTPPLPAVPTGLTATPTGGGQLDLSWTGPAGSAAYAIYVYGSDGTTQLQETTASSFTLAGLTPNTYYTYTVVAWSGSQWGGWAGWSAWALVT